MGNFTGLVLMGELRKRSQRLAFEFLLAQRHVQDVVHVSCLHPSARSRRSGSLRVLLQGHVVVLNGLGKVTSLVLACTSRVSSVDVVRIDLEHRREILHALVNVSDLLEGTASDIESARVRLVDLHERIAVLDGLFVALLLQERGSADEESFLVEAVVR